MRAPPWSSRGSKARLAAAVLGGFVSWWVGSEKTRGGGAIHLVPPLVSNSFAPAMTVVVGDIDLGDASGHGEIFGLLTTLRPDLVRAESDRFLAAEHRRGLRGVAARGPHGELIGLALYRVVATSRGRLVLLDDLVTRPDARSQGIGDAVMAQVEARGRRAGCDRIELDSGVSNRGAHRFYERRRFAAIAVHFAKNLG